ncbi:MAG: hypothetical protein G01um101433_886 [Parcubacteria group bacterium Gr01-1014_33]|nr:MAG: hypothetical protein G01um101433_886 [Parcubacteria group bacterium Gr01-1014_33]
MNAGGVDKACKSNAGYWSLENGNWICYNIFMQNFRDLEVYQRCQGLFPKVYRLVRSWPPLDQRELGSQMIRAANSIHANIAEGYGKSPNDFKRYLTTAIGSCDELVSHLNDAQNVGLVSLEIVKEFVAEYAIVGKQLTRLKQKWK